jgi:hypothetical protein
LKKLINKITVFLELFQMDKRLNEGHEKFHAGNGRLSNQPEIV